MRRDVVPHDRLVAPCFEMRCDLVVEGAIRRADVANRFGGDAANFSDTLAGVGEVCLQGGGMFERESPMTIAVNADAMPICVDACDDVGELLHVTAEQKE